MLILVIAMLHVAGSRTRHSRDISSDGGGCRVGSVRAGSLEGGPALAVWPERACSRGEEGGKNRGPPATLRGTTHTVHMQADYLHH